jgi:hypothetical protein
MPSITLMLELLPLGVILHFQNRLELAPLRRLETLEYDVLAQLEAQDPGFRVLAEEGHVEPRCAAAKAEARVEYNRENLTGVKAGLPATTYI